MNLKNSSGIASYIIRWIISLDLVMLVSLALLIALGTIILFSASGENMHMMNRHSIHLAIATIVMFIATQFSSDFLRRWSIWLYIIGIVFLVLVLVQGSIGKGAQRWLEIGSFRFQPSEIMKLAVPMMVASYFSQKDLPPRFKHIVVACLLVLIPMMLIVQQPDLGTSLLVGCAGFFVI